ncbi:MAG: class I SAM-dependent methyltransferase [Mycobacterium sp.]
MVTNSLGRIRDLIDPTALIGDQSAGYLDLLPPAPDQPQRAAQRAMNNPLVAAVYEGPWRQGQAFLYTGMTPSGERRRASQALRLRDSQLLLDVACGPGNFTQFLSEDLDTGGVAIGLDFSVPMLRKAVQDHSGKRVGYVRGDARTLPFEDGAFDAVCCFAALYLVPEPYKVLDEMIRTLAPGGRIAVMTSCVRGPKPIRWLSTKLAELQGLHGFERANITSVLRDARFRNIEQEIRGLSQFVSATKS